MVVVALLALECGMRMGGSVLSTDLRHIRQIPNLASELAGADGTRVLFLGNSLTREGFDPETFSRSLQESSTTPTESRSVYPDDTTIVEWSALFKHYFIDADRVPDVLVLGFARDHLSDGTQVHPSRLARFYTSLSDIPRIFRYEVIDFEGRFEYLLSYVSSAFGNRRRVPRRFFDLWIPHFREFRRVINENLQADPSSVTSRPLRSYKRLEQFIHLLKAQDVHTVLVAMPIAAGYPLDASLCGTLDIHGIELIDARSVPGISPTSYRDGQHLNPGGARTYTKWLARRLTDQLARESR
jgi:hypothetical protein